MEIKFETTDGIAHIYLAQLPAKAYGINKLMARRQALDIMAADLAA